MVTLDDNQSRIWKDRYALKDNEGNLIETSIEQTWHRVANFMADDFEEEVAFYDILDDFRFVPGGRILSGAGAEKEKTFYNCYVIPVEYRRPPSMLEKDFPGNDSRESIFATIQTMVDIMSRGGGVGINWSTLRPSGSYLSRVSGNSSGPVGWMDVASAAVGEVEQGGSRRGAAMFMLDDWHPDVLRFINEKRDGRKITNANVSVAISDAFMKAVENDDDWHFIFPDTKHPDYNKTWDGDIKAWQSAGRPVTLRGTRPAREVWDAICEAAHASGEPGVVFLDRYNELSTANGAERIICVNPCGEQGLGAYSVCNLGAMNLDAYIEGGKFDNWPNSNHFMWDEFRADVRTAIRFLDNVIDKTYYFMRETELQQQKLRRIGLGVMGLADCLVRLGYTYGDKDAVDFTSGIFAVMKAEAIGSSIEIASRKGAAHGWRSFMEHRPYLEGIPIPYTGMRNLFLLTQAPTGTTSLLAGVNSGIEPYFDLKVWREDRTGGRWQYAKAVQEIILTHDLPDYVVTANDVSVEQHIAMQAAVQRWVDSSVSKTINAPNSQTLEETKKAFTLAYASGLKGLAYYRDGSRGVQVLYHDDPNVIIANLEAKVKELSAKLAFQQRGIYHATGGNIEIVTGVDRDDVCPACKTGTIRLEEGCKLCHSCGWSAC